MTLKSVHHIILTRSHGYNFKISHSDSESQRQNKSQNVKIKMKIRLKHTQACTLRAYVQTHIHTQAK